MHGCGMRWRKASACRLPRGRNVTFKGGTGRSEAVGVSSVLEQIVQIAWNCHSEGG